MAFAYIFDAKVANYQAKDNSMSRMAPEARGGRTLMVAVFPEMFLRRILDRTPDCGSP